MTETIATYLAHFIVQVLPWIVIGAALVAWWVEGGD